ncbi:MAG: DNA polymerase IV [Desulfobacterota bacterium]|nr:DNA polymerase IV [Thermodesulfobacteriota bacterium]
MAPAPTAVRQIIHLDMDAFYASVEVLDDPSLKGRPVIVGGLAGRGVVSAASYEARKFGVHSAQPMTTARRLCPQGVFLPVRMSRYQDLSRKIFSLFRAFTPLVEPLSIDEAFLDVTASLQLFGPAREIARLIKTRVREETGLTVSAGVAPNKFLAKIASDLEKPDGLTVVPEERIQEFLNPLPIERLWGVGPATRKELRLLRVETIGDLRRLPTALLEQRLGESGRKLAALSRGLDDREVQPVRENKSIGNEETFAADLLDPQVLRKHLLALCHKTARRMRGENFAGRTVTLKVKYHDFTRTTRSQTLEQAVDDGPVLYRIGCELLGKTDAGRRPIRLIGISISQPARASGQLLLFQPLAGGEKRKKINQALDDVCQRYGTRALGPASLMAGREDGT